ncbi:MAG: hypothetical protein GY928_31385 [Colwellia sp.]|nr:hypothetical protein [Colwellia sp.]
MVANYDDLVDSKKYKASAGVFTNSIRIAVTCDDSDLMGCLEIPSEGTIDMLVNSFEEFAVSLREL